MARLLLVLLCCYLFITATAQPTITSFSPVKAKPGDAVTITGTGFNTTAANNIVFFGGIRAAVNTASATSLNVTVPIGATYAPITVLNTATSLAAQSLQNFHPTYSPNKTGITGSDFSAGVDFPAGQSNYGSAVAMADIDGDGKLDIVLSSYLYGVSVMRNTSSTGNINSASFATPHNLGSGQIGSVAIADFDGDGKLDIVARTVWLIQQMVVQVYRNLSTPGSINFDDINTADLITGGGSSTDIVSSAAADFDGDGKPDLALTDQTDNLISIFRNTSVNGTISFGTEQTFGTANNPVFVTTGDVDGDGKIDLVSANAGNANVSVLRSTSTSGTINFAARVDFTTGSDPRCVALGDIDGDGKSDIAVSNYASANISVLRNTATSGSINSGSFAAKVDFATGLQPLSVSIGDIDGDGKPDLAVANGGSSSISVLRNTASSGSISSGSFAAKVDFATNSNLVFAAIGDLDGDSKPDIAGTYDQVIYCTVFRSTDIPLPVQLTSFKAIQQGSSVKISWNTAEESGIETYEVQRSIDGKNFSAIATAKANNIGNSSYTIMDEKPQKGTNWYRLLIKSRDNNNKYSSIVSVKIEGKGDGILVYPNPVSNGKLNLQLTAEKGDYTITLTNNLGKLVWQSHLKHAGGSITESFSLPAIPKGGYTLQVTGTVITFSQKVVF